ncbi:MAG: single-stranded DNA-binding protein [Candidatus Fimivivens sp.]|nr:single-stranded DNA-binding protein [Candidatus Fimivivens sp.]
MNTNNLSILVGRCVADPEMRTTPNGIAVATVRIAVDRPYRKDKDKKTDFFTVEAWRAQAPYLCRNWRKGKPIAVIGEAHEDPYTDKDGVKRNAYKVVADQISFTLGEKQNGQQPEPPIGDIGADDCPPIPGDTDVPPDDNDLNF